MGPPQDGNVSRSLLSNRHPHTPFEKIMKEMDALMNSRTTSAIVPEKKPLHTPYCSGLLNGYPTCCIDAFNAMIRMKEEPKRKYQIRVLEAKKVLEANFDPTEANKGMGDSYIDGFVPCECCAEKILAGTPFTEIIKRPWPLEMDKIHFTKENEPILVAFFDHLDSFGFSTKDMDRAVAVHIFNPSLNRDALGQIRMMGYREYQKLNWSKRKKAKIGCNEKYRERLKNGEFDRPEDFCDIPKTNGEVP